MSDPTPMGIEELSASSGGRERGRAIGAISIAPIKSLALSHPDEVELREAAVAGDREFFLVDDEGRLFAGVRCPSLLKVRPEVVGSWLALHFPDGTTVDGEVVPGREITTAFYAFRDVVGNEVIGPWADAISGYVGRRVRLVKARLGDGYDLTPVTIVSTASVQRLSQESGLPVDHRRFRMLFRVDGCAEHEEDVWRRVAVGDAVVRIESQLGRQVPRCDVITRHPDTAERDLDALRLIKRYRGRTRAGVVFGVYATVEMPGRVRLGDPVEPLE